MNKEGFDLEEWSDEFLDQLFQFEEEIVVSSTSTQYHGLPPPPQFVPPPSHSVIQVEEEIVVSSTSTQYHGRPPPPQFVPPPSHSVASTSSVNFSPPRHLSQKFQDNSTKNYDHISNALAQSRISSTVSCQNNIIVSGNAKEQEIDSLKRELRRVSKQLTHLEKECLDLKKERDKKEEEPTFKDAKVHCRESTNLVVHDTIQDGGVYRVNNQEYPAAPSGCKNIGIQTEKAGESADLIIENDLSTNHQLPRKLLCVWESTSNELTGRNLVSKLFVACETDFHVLFGYLSSNSSKTTVDSIGNSSDVPMWQAKISCLYSVLTKITNGLVNVEAMLEALIDLCRLDNAVIVYRSLHILHVVLNHLSSVKKNNEKRDNVMVEGPSSVSKSTEKYGSSFSNSKNLFQWNATETSDAVIKPFNPENVFKKGDQDHWSTLSTTGVDWISLFELMQQIIIRHHEELVRLEAVSTMNIILMRSSAYLEREKYGVMLQNVSQLLRKESGPRVQKQAVHLVYLLLNCPQIMSMFCSGCKEEMENAGAAICDTRKASTTQQFGKILEGLADCLPCHGNGTLVLQLRRNAIILLAFLVSSGKSGLEILISHEFSERTNFFALILKILVAEMDVEASESIHPSEIFKERTLLMREALIFLNRLVSNAQYSAPVLRILTNSRDMAFLTIDIANRLSRKGKWLWQSDTVIRNMRESEIANLAQIFKRKVFNFLGHNSSSKQN